MFTRLIKVEKINVDGVDYEIRYFQNTKLNGKLSFASEVNVGPDDKVILDDHSMASLKYKVNLILPVSLQSRGGMAKAEKARGEAGP